MRGKGMVRMGEALRRDRAYVVQRDRLIPVAERHADRVAGPRDEATDREEWATCWNRAFLRKMDELARKGGLI